MHLDENTKWVVIVYGYDGDKQYFKEVIGPPMTFEEADKIADEVDDKESTLSEFTDTVPWREGYKYEQS